MALATGTRLGPYEVLELLGAGGMGEVYRARDPRLGREVAIKVLPADRLADPARRARFLQEARAASALSHPNIVTIHEVEAEGDVDFLVMEYVAGRTLDTLIPRQGMRLNEALRVAIPLADALATAHTAGIVHRDLKPANVMVTPDGTVKVLDFGLAKLLHPMASESGGTTTIEAHGRPLSGVGTVAGTVGYMSPEQATGAVVDARSDIFSFGALLYELVTGRRAFAGASSAETLAAILKEQPTPLREVVPDVPAELERILVRCLRKDPTRRFQHMQDVRVELQEIKEESDSGTAAAKVVVHPRRWRWMAAGLVAVLVVGFLAASNYTTWRRERNAPLQASPSLTQLTSYPGTEFAPSFSPDGTHVAFAWNGEDRRNVDIYLKAVDGTSGPPLRLTTNPAVDVMPAWSPDGRFIAFRRTVRPTDAPRHADLMIVPALGGPERRVASVALAGGTSLSWTPASLSWTPDAKWIATLDSDPSAGTQVVLIPVGQGERRRLTSDRATAAAWPTISPDGRWLAYAACAGPWTCEARLLRLGAGYVQESEPRRLTPGRVSFAGIAWSADAQELVYSASRAGANVFYLWRLPLSEGSSPVRIDLARGGAVQPVVSRAGRRLAYSESTNDDDIWRIVGTGPARPLLSSTKGDRTPDLSPDGKQLAFCSNRASEEFEVFISGADGSNAVQITDQLGREQGSPRWSPDGKQLVFDSQTERGDWDLFAVDAAGGSPRLLASTPSMEWTGSWSRDGRFVYFSSNRSGRFEIWRVSATGGSAEQVTDAGGFTALESLDGRTLYYVKTIASPQPLFARRLGTPGETQIAGDVLGRSFAVDETGLLYFVLGQTPGWSSLRHLDATTGKVREVATLECLPSLGLTASRDGKTILFGARKPANDDLFVIENFR